MKSEAEALPRALCCLLSAAFLSSWASPADADNPIVQTLYTADPAPMVHGDTVYLCTSHDEDVTVADFFTMNDWRVYSSRDIVNWTDHGSPLGYQSFSWASGKAWAPHCVERAGRFYMYVPVSDAIGVAVSDSPTGPFEDAIGSPLLSNYQYIDPTVFIDDDGQAYLYFGNPRLWYVRLNEDMVSYSGQIEQVPQDAASFGQRTGDADRPTQYEEGPWFYKRNDLYYMIYPAGGIPEDIAYSTSPGPTGPWTYQGIIMENVAGHAFTNHPGIVDFKGHSFFFYHTQDLPGGGGFKRSVAVEEFTYESDGSIPTIPKTSQGPDAVDNLSPYERVEGETIAWTGGVETEVCSAGGMNVTAIENGDTIKVKSVDFWTGAVSFEASVASDGAGGNIELHLDSQDGPLIATCPVTSTGGWQTWATVSCDVSSEATDVHDLFLVFTGSGGSLFNLDYWQFTSRDPLPGTGGTTGLGGSSSGGSAGSFAVGGAVNAGGSGAMGMGGSGMAGATSVGTGASITTTGAPAMSTSGGVTNGLGGAASFGATGAGGNTATPVPSTAQDGCSCRTTSGGSTSSWGVGGLVGLLLTRRRRARRCAGRAMPFRWEAGIRALGFPR